MKTSPSLRLAAVAASVAVLGMASAAHATLIAYDGFTGDTPGASLNTAAASEGTGWGAGWSAYQSSATGTDPSASVTNPNLSYNGNAYGNAVQLAQVSGVNAYDFRPFSQTMTPTSSVFVSFLLSNVGAGGNNVDILSVYDGSSVPTYNSTYGLNTGYVMSFGTFNNAGDLGISYVSATNNQSSTISTTALTNPSTVSLLVLEMDYRSNPSTDTAELYLDPTTSTTTAQALLTFTGAILDQAGTDNPSLTMVRIGANSAAGTGGIFDEITVGTTLADVIPTPEPASMGILALASLALLRRRPLLPGQIAK